MRRAAAAPLSPVTEWLMCPPRDYAIRYEINPWMSMHRPVAPARAARQWAALRRLLLRLGARVRLLRPAAGLPDLTFTANAGLAAGRVFVRSNFRHPERRGEEPVAEAWFRRRGWRVVRLPRGIGFEGEGDAVRCGDKVFLGFRFRSEAPAHEALSRVLDRAVLPLELADPRFYHLDTCFAPLDGRTALWFPKAFDRYGRRVIEANVEDLVAAGEGDALRFACNAIAFGGRVIAHRGLSPALRRALERRRFAVHETDLSEFLKAGGAAKCLVLYLGHDHA